MLKDDFPVHEDKQRKDSDFSLTTEEENAIRYVGGYVIVSLTKKEGDEELLAGLHSFIEKERNETAAFPASAAWVEVDRGGLMKITEEAHQFFVALEGSVRSYLMLSKAHIMDNKAHIMDNTTLSPVKSGVFADSDVQFSWCLTGIIMKVGEDRAEELLEMCIDKWLTIRGYSLLIPYKKCSNSKQRRVLGKLNLYAKQYINIVIACKIFTTFNEFVP